MYRKMCCVTGHRDIPPKLVDFVKKALIKEVESAVSEGFTDFASGFAEGADQFFAEIVAGMRKKSPDLRLIAAIPYRKRLESLQKRAKTADLLHFCSEIVVIRENYYPGIYEERNRWMVERSERVIAVCDGRKTGGTVGTLRMAKSAGREIRLIALPGRERED